MTHLLTVTRVPDETSDDVEWKIDGPHDDACAVWRGCRDDSLPCRAEPGPYDRPDADPRAGFDALDLHGVEHRWIEGEWMTDTGQCAASHADSVQDDLYAIAQSNGIGEYRINIDYTGGGDWLALLVEDDPVAAE